MGKVIRAAREFLKKKKEKKTQKKRLKERGSMEAEMPQIHLSPPKQKEGINFKGRKYAG